MIISDFLKTYVYLGLAVIVVGWLPPVGRILAFSLNPRIHPERNFTALRSPAIKSRRQAWLDFLTGPWLSFHRPANRRWAHGYVFYHLGILTIVGGYALAGGILVWKWFHGQPILDLSTGLFSREFSPLNWLALVFGSGERLPQEFLFGQWSPVVMVIGWLELACAVDRNGCLLASLWVHGQGSLNGDLDQAAAGIRVTGKFSGQHWLVRGIIFAIILSEFVGRLGLVPGFAYTHAALGLTLLALTPYTYLSHILIAHLAVSRAVARRRFLTLA